MAAENPRQTGTARARLLDAAYRLFSVHGIGRVGVDAIVTQSGCAKASLYNNFDSKEDLALAFLDLREQTWTRSWLEAQVRQRAPSAPGRLLAIFELFDEWFQRDDFEGCSFINVLLESDVDSKIRLAATDQLAKIRAIVRGYAEQAGYVDAPQLASVWHMLMKGSIVAAGEGNRAAARDARRAAALILDAWPRSGEESAA